MGGGADISVVVRHGSEFFCTLFNDFVIKKQVCTYLPTLMTKNNKTMFFFLLQNECLRGSL